LSQPVGWEKAAAEEEEYEAAEEVRLQYVAATRARNMLVVSAYAGDIKNKAWKTIDEALGDVPELPSVPVDQGEGKREKLVLKKAEVERARKEISAGFESASQPTYAVESVTSLAKKERELPARRHDTGLGLSWGRLVHQVLEAIGSGRLGVSASKLRSFVENILTAEEADFSDTGRLLAHVGSILGSPFWARVMKAEKRYFEIPFSIRTSQRELSDFPMILTGTIDLVFWAPAQDGKPAGWVIADYKTDLIRPQLLEEDLARLVAVYAPQVRLYTQFWQEITGEPVIESGLYFTCLNRWVQA